MDRDTRLKRLRFRAWHRGTKEADLMIGGFFDAHSRRLERGRASPGSRRCSRSRTSTSWPGRSEPQPVPARYARADDDRAARR